MTNNKNFAFETKSKIGACINGVYYARKKSGTQWLTSKNFSENQPEIQEVELSEEIISQINKLIEEKKAERNIEREAQMIRIEEIQKEREEKFEKEYAEIQKMIDAKIAIPTTIENLKLVMTFLKDHNWGSWTLPAMTIAYSANQYDCDGSVAVTIVLDKQIEFDNFFGEKIREKKFKVGGKRGHLEKYYAIR